jgi:hypothetical protein
MGYGGGWRRRRRSHASSVSIGRRRGGGRRRGNWLAGLSRLSRLLLLEKVDNEVLVLANKVVRQALRLQIFPKMLPP